jgi:tRNA-intron endonuclease, archaea type
MEKIKALIMKGNISSNCKFARELNHKSHFGEIEGDKIVYMPEEAFYLFEEKKLEFYSINYKLVPLQEVLKRMNKIIKNFNQRYIVYRDLRKKGLILKSGLKFGSDFRVYDKGIKINKSHSRWLCFCKNEGEKIDVRDFCLKNRVVNSTKKILLLAVVDFENEVSYYESNWKKIV